MDPRSDTAPGPGPGPGQALLPQHAALIEASAISPEVARARGYRSVESRAELRRLGFSDRQCQAPALLIPIWSVAGEVGNYQIRPDEPRVDRKLKDGEPRIIKYETVQGSRMILDVPPPARAWLGDPKRPLFVTEGARKADSAVSAGLACLALLGVWNWRGTNEDGGRVALADWESVALSGRTVYLAFDSDVVTNPTVAGALGRLRSFLGSRGARVRIIYLPAGEGGQKTGLDDYLAGGHSAGDLLALARDELPQAAGEASMAAILAEIAGGPKGPDGSPDVAAVYTAARDLARLPAAEYATVKAALRNRFGRSLNLNDLDRAVGEARRAIGRGAMDPGREGLPEIVVSGRPLREWREESLAALEAANDPPVLFVRSGALARVRADEEGRPIIDAVDNPMLRGRLATVANFVKRSEDGPTHVVPPMELAQDLMALGTWSLPALQAVAEVPVLRMDGTVLDTPGYDPLTRLIYSPVTGLAIPPVPRNPTDAEVSDALDLVGDAVGEFPYSDQASRANGLGLLLTPVLRPAFRGCAPLALIDAPKAGTGKGLYSDVVALIATGRMAPKKAAPKEDEEWRKMITSTLNAGATVIVLDNIETNLFSPALAIALTTTVWEDRILGKNQVVTLPQRATWIATGNNIRLGGDLKRRCYWIRLDSMEAKPWMRSGFRHPDLAGWVREHRGPLLAALLTMARAWFAAGCPRSDTQTLGSFEDWTRVVGSILAFVGVPGFLANLDQLYERADDDAAEWDNWIRLWYEILGDRPITVATLLAKLAEYSVLKDAMPDALGTMPADEKDMGKFKVRVGKALRKRVDVMFGPCRLECLGADSDSGVRLWRVTDRLRGSGGSGGDSLLTRCATHTFKGEGKYIEGDAENPRNPRTPGSLQPSLEMDPEPEEHASDGETEEWRF